MAAPREQVRPVVAGATNDQQLRPQGDLQPGANGQQGQQGAGGQGGQQAGLAGVNQQPMPGMMQNKWAMPQGQKQHGQLPPFGRGQVPRGPGQQYGMAPNAGNNGMQGWSPTMNMIPQAFGQGAGQGMQAWQQQGQGGACWQPGQGNMQISPMFANMGGNNAGGMQTWQQQWGMQGMQQPPMGQQLPMGQQFGVPQELGGQQLGGQQLGVPQWSQGPGQFEGKGNVPMQPKDITPLQGNTAADPTVANKPSASNEQATSARKPKKSKR